MTKELKERGMEMNGQDGTDRDTLFLLGGAAMIVFGAGLILSTPTIRRYLGGANLGDLVQAAAPDFERYLKLRAM